MIFFDLVDELFSCLTNSEKLPFDLFTTLLSIFASETLGVPLFNKDALKKMTVPYLAKLLLLMYVNWLDYSLLKLIVESSKNDHAIKLVNEFDLLLDKSKLITEYPIPTPSKFLIPLDGSDYSLVATKSRWRITDATLQEIINTKLLLVHKWEISECSIQLVALHAKFNYLYWLIPKGIAQVIQSQKSNSKVQQELRKEGIIMTVIFPTVLLTDNDDFIQTIAAGPFWFITSMSQGNIPVIILQ